MEPLLTGILVDVSGSMQVCTGEGTDTKDGEWARTIFSVINNLIKNDLKSNNHVFAFGFGAGREADPRVFDLLGSLGNIKRFHHSLQYILNDILDILEKNGASNIRKFLPINTWMNALGGHGYECELILERLQKDSNFVRYVVQDCLPSICRDYEGNGLNTIAKNWIYSKYCSAIATVFPGSKEVIVNIFKMIDSRIKKPPDFKTLRSILNEIISILKLNGARYITEWAPMYTLIHALKGQNYKCELVLKRLQHDMFFVRYVVEDCLPQICRFYNYKGRDYAAIRKNVYNSVVSSTVTKFYVATKSDIDDVVKKIELVIDVLEPASAKSVLEVHDAHNILNGQVGNENELSEERVHELMDTVRPYVYGRTALIEGLCIAARVFSENEYRNHTKLLFVLSDGMPTSEFSVLASVINSQLINGAIQKNDVTVISCFITSSNIDPFVLYNSETNTQSWDCAAQFMFDLSSTIQTQKVPRTIFLKREWKVEMNNNETQLFLQVNHPDHLQDACEFAHDVVTNQESLSDVLAVIDLDIYISGKNAEFRIKDRQVGPTCYANASAAVMHLAMMRILGRDGDYPEFEFLREEMILCYSKQPEGEQGANTHIVLQEMCPRYRLKCKKIDKKEAMRAVMEKRPVVARFSLTRKEWSNFGRFFAYNPKGILTSDDVDISKRNLNEKTIGHAVVLTSFNSKNMRLMNSWGTEFADDGFFNVKNADVLDLEFFDVYWDEDDLKPTEKAYYDAHGSRVSEKLMRNLKGLQESIFECPLCRKKSRVTEFKGRLSRTICPKCKGAFKCGTKGNVLALNLYLSSLSNISVSKEIVDNETSLKSFLFNDYFILHVMVFVLFVFAHCVCLVSSWC